GIGRNNPVSARCLADAGNDEKANGRFRGKDAGGSPAGFEALDDFFEWVLVLIPRDNAPGDLQRFADGGFFEGRCDDKKFAGGGDDCQRRSLRTAPSYPSEVFQT